MEQLKSYFEELIKTDSAIAAVYSESKLDACWKYVISQARKKAVNQCAMIEDSIVFKWARDFMLGDVVDADTSNAPTSKVLADGIVEINPDTVSLEEKKKRVCKDCGYLYQGTCQYEAKNVNENDPACEHLIFKEMPKNKKLVIEKVEETKPQSKQKKNNDDKNQLFFDFGE